MDIDGGRMDGFIGQAESAIGHACRWGGDATCRPQAPDRRDRLPHDQRENPEFLGLRQKLRAPGSACSSPTRPGACRTSSWCLSGRPSAVGWTTRSLHQCAAGPATVIGGASPTTPGPISPGCCRRFPTGVELEYVAEGTEPDCDDDAMTCPAKPQSARTRKSGTRCPSSTTVHQDGQLGNIQTLDHFYADVRADSLHRELDRPQRQGERASVGAGQYGTGLRHRPHQHPHAEPGLEQHRHLPGLGRRCLLRPRGPASGRRKRLRAAGARIGHRPCARQGYDHQTLSFDAYVKFIEDDFLRSQRLDPRTDGRPDPRPTVREDVSVLGDLIRDFDFNQTPRPPLILPGGVTLPAAR